MRRRKFIALLGGAAAQPIAAHGQQGERMRRASVLMSYVESDTGAQKWAKAFDDSLQELGWNNGRHDSETAFGPALHLMRCCGMSAIGAKSEVARTVFADGDKGPPLCHQPVVSCSFRG